MRIKDKLQLRHVGNDYIIINPGQEMIDMTKVFSLNESAAWLWQQLIDKDFTEEYATGLLLERYDVSRERAMEDVHSLIGLLEREHLLEENKDD